MPSGARRGAAMIRQSNFRRRLLFVGDEESIRLSLPPLLQTKGFEVRVAANVPEALVEINSRYFDVLITDLNIGEQGNVFLVVSAMRHLQPYCVNLILTGYPALETAVQAIQGQVDDYLMKPSEPDALVTTINQKLESRWNKLLQNDQNNFSAREADGEAARPTREGREQLAQNRHRDL